MTQTHARATARDILRVVPLVMRTVAAELRAAGELPAPAHFGLLSFLAAQPSPLTLTELAARQGVTLPTMSNSVTALVARGWVRRAVGPDDRRQARIDVTAKGRAAVGRVGRSAEAHLAELIAPLDADARKRLQAGLAVLLTVFARHPGAEKSGAAAPAQPVARSSPARRSVAPSGSARRRRGGRRPRETDTP